MSEDAAGPQTAQDAAVEAYWATARKRAGLDRLDVVVGQQPLGTVPPPAWSFGSDPTTADARLALLLEGRKTATASPAQLYGWQGVPLPAPGDLSIVLDGAGRPRALVVTTGVDVVPFRDVDAAHVAAEGEGDVDRWRTEHEELFTAELAAAGLPFAPTVPVVLERFRLLDPKPPRHTRQPVTT
ncbi:ASCH domain-containing protein [uncultured Georgenia sp.]|uniref:ASCH domain-containing protein n=1 Tax=uncultured Georgenia sp. TaxID=378209 RepID=UPI00262A0EED|nr:ASCH domain-containing protein [uncultured Georgenia sp.]HLV03123.1 ASCH domain-containing protein [Actinomycetaceae bacterium]